MGHHFVPQRYLRNFEDPKKPGYVWVHDKRGGKARLASIAKLAQSKAFYTPETESLLARMVEQPGNRVIQKLVTNTEITVEERLQVALYIGVMLKRVPTHRRRSSEMIPGVLKETVDEIRQQLKEMANDLQADPAILTKRELELDAAERKFPVHPPAEMLRQIREPWPSKNIVELLFRMTWRILISSGPTFFVTSDNPAFFFQSYGLGRKESELSFPLSGKYCLHGSWQRAPSGLIFFRAEQPLVKQINLRLVSQAERLVFYHQSTEWIASLFGTSEPQLSVIRWDHSEYGQAKAEDENL